MLLLHNIAYIHELPVADLYRWSWGRWMVSENVLKLLQQKLTKSI